MSTALSSVIWLAGHSLFFIVFPSSPRASQCWHRSHRPLRSGNPCHRLRRVDRLSSSNRASRTIKKRSSSSTAGQGGKIVVAILCKRGVRFFFSFVVRSIVAPFEGDEDLPRLYGCRVRAWFLRKHRVSGSDGTFPLRGTSFASAVIFGFCHFRLIFECGVCGRGRVVDLRSVRWSRTGNLLRGAFRIAPRDTFLVVQGVSELLF